jgi:hypothetical protein
LILLGFVCEFGGKGSGGNGFEKKEITSRRNREV